MPSFTNILSIALLAALPIAASPIAPTTASRGGPPGGNGFTTPSAPVSAAAAPSAALPLSGDATELPITSLPLAYVAIGRGIQNYSCSAVGAVPVAIGAIATLYDATSIATSDMSTLNSIPGLAVDVAEEGNDCFQLPAANRNLPVLGNHFFLADGTPTFDLGPVGKSIEAAKNASVAAPTSAPIGPAGTGAVAWLFLTAKPAPYTSVGLAAVYRVETAGGNPTATCNATGTLSMQYSAEYWFYSPAA